MLSSVFCSCFFSPLIVIKSINKKGTRLRDKCYMFLVKFGTLTWQFHAIILKVHVQLISRNRKSLKQSTYMLFCSLAFGRFSIFSFKQYNFPPIMQLSIYGSSWIILRSMGNILWSTGFSEPGKALKLLVSNHHSLVVKYWRTSSPVDILFWILTMLKVRSWISQVVFLLRAKFSINFIYTGCFWPWGHKYKVQFYSLN